MWNILGMRKATNLKLSLVVCISLLLTAQLKAEKPANNYCQPSTNDTRSLSKSAIADALGWVVTNDNRCGGYYLEAPFINPDDLYNNKSIKITGNQGVFSLHGTSIYQGKVIITQNEQEITTSKAYLYRNPTTEKFSGIDLIGNVSFREPNSLVLARCGHI